MIALWLYNAYAFSVEFHAEKVFQRSTKRGSLLFVNWIPDILHRLKSIEKWLRLEDGKYLNNTVIGKYVYIFVIVLRDRTRPCRLIY